MSEASESAGRVSAEYIQFKKLIEGLRMADDAARMIGYSRGDERWIHAAGLIHSVREKVTRLGNMVIQ